MATRNDFTENEKNSKSELNFSCPKCRCRWSGLRYNCSIGRRFRSVGRSNLLFVRYVDRGLRRIDNYGISNGDYLNGRWIFAICTIFVNKIPSNEGTIFFPSFNACIYSTKKNCHTNEFTFKRAVLKLAAISIKWIDER